MNEKLKMAGLGYGPHTDLRLLMRVFLSGSEDEKREALRLAQEIMNDFGCVDCKFYDKILGKKDCGNCSLLGGEANSWGLCDGFIKQEDS